MKNSGTEDRGYVLGSTEELNKIVEDNMMTMHSIASSRFIGPFLSTVQKWEKQIRLVAEVVEEWLTVQSKWLYLEGIFVGGDIRLQLPEEAKKFDDIDKYFRKIMVESAKNPNVLECCQATGRRL